MWTKATRAQHNRDGLRFASDLTGAEWAVLEPLLPPPSPVGRPPAWPMREIVEAVFCVLRGGVPRRMPPKCFPPRPTMHGWSAAFRDAGVWEAVNHYLVMLERERSGREASPSAAVIDGQSVKTAEAGGPRGYDAGKKVRGRKRHAMADTDGRLLVIQVGPAPCRSAASVAPELRLHRAHVRRHGLCWRAGRAGGPHRHRDRPQTPRSGRLRRASAQAGRGTLLRVAQPQAAIASASVFLCAASVMLLAPRLARCG